MPITPFLRNQTFEPEMTDAMSSVFTRVCADLGLKDRTDQLTEIVARYIIEAAQRCIRNETALYLHVVQKFKANQE